MNGIRANIDSDKSIDVLLHVIKEVVAELHPSWPKTGKILPESLLTQDLGLDSLARVELLTRVERSFGVTLEEKIFIDAETPRDLWQAIIKASPSLKPVAAGKIREVEIEDTPDLPFNARTLVDVLNWHVENHPERPHIRLYSDEDDGEIVTYRQLGEGARAAYPFPSIRRFV